MTVWQSGPRRWLKAPVRQGVGSNLATFARFASFVLSARAWCQGRPMTPAGTRTCNPRLRRPMPYPLGLGDCCLPSAFRCGFWASSLLRPGLGGAAPSAKVPRCWRALGEAPVALDGRLLRPQGASGPSTARWRHVGHGATVARLTPGQKAGRSNLSALAVHWSPAASSSADCHVCSHASRTPAFRL
jgi:hypothetical protein